MPGLIANILAEIKQVERIATARTQARDKASSWTPNQAMQAAFASRLFPAMRPGVVSALTKAGYRPDSDVFKMAGEQATRQWMQDHPNGAGYGERTALPRNKALRAQAASAENYVQSLASRAPALPIPDRETQPDSYKAWLDMSGAGLFKEHGLPEEPEGDDEKADRIFTDATFAFLREGQPFAYVDRKGRARVAEADPDKSPVMENGRQIAPGFSIRTLKTEDEERIQAAEEAEAAEGGGAPGFAGPISRAGLSLEGGVNVIPRQSLALLNAPIQEAVGQVRNLYGVSQGRDVNFLEPQSDFLIAATSEHDDMGSGFFVDPESEVWKERNRREAERGQIAGHNFTVGRWVANDILNLNPDTKPFQLMSGTVDAGVQIFGDPSNIALAGFGSARRTADLFQAAGAARVGATGLRRANPTELSAGLIRGLIPAFQPKDGAKWLDSELGQQSLGWFAANKNTRDIARTMSYKGDPKIWARLADTNTPDEVRAVLEPELGIRIRQASTVQVNPDRPFKELRPWNGDMPRQESIDAHDAKMVAREAEAHLRNLKAPEEEIDRVFDKAARAENPEELNAVLTREVAGHGGVGWNVLKDLGYDDEKASSILQIYAGKHKADRRAMIHEHAEQGSFPDSVLIGGEHIDTPGLPLLSELSPRYITMFDAREARRAVSEQKAIWSNPAIKVSRIGLEHLTNSFKRIQLMRPAWGTRVIGMEQLRMAGAHYASMFNHPLRYISFAMALDPASMPARTHLWDYLRPISGAKVATRKALEATQKIPGIRGFAPRAAELELADEFTDAMTARHGAYLDQPTMVKVGNKTTYHRDDIDARPQFRESLADELVHLSADPIAAYVANADSLDEAVEWFTRGAGNEFRGRMATAYPTRFADSEGARKYIEDIQERINYVTGSNGDLLNAVKTGKFRGDDILQGTTINGDFRSALDEYENFWPERIIGEDYQMRRATEASQWEETRDQFVNWAFGHLMTEHTNRLSRSATFKQAYWNESERLIPFATEEGKQALIAQARGQNMGSRAIRRMERTPAKGELAFKDIDEVAKGWGLEATKDLLYDLQKRGRFMDAARLVALFGEAWKEEITRWGTLIKDNPSIVRRAQQAYQGALGEDLGDFVGNEDGQGLFFKNSFGEMVFIYPGSKIVSEKMLDVPVPLAGRVQGLSMFGSVIPSLGPTLQIPVAGLLASKPGPEWLKEALYDVESQEIPFFGTVGEQLVPFGAPGQEDPGDIFNVLNYLPPYIRSFANYATNGAANERTWGNDVAFMMTSLKSTGDYGDSPEEMQRLEDDAQARVKRLYLIQGVAKSILPSAPDEDWRTFTKDDGWTSTRALAVDWRRIIDKNEGDFDSALVEFVELYGENALGATLPHYSASEYAVPMTEEGVQWVLTNPGIENDLPHTYGFFAPEPEEGKEGSKLDLSLFNENLRTGERIVVTPEQFRIMMTNVSANMIYSEKKGQVGDNPTDEQEEWLAEWRSHLSEEYPSWGDETGKLGRPQLSQLVRELYDAEEHDAVRGTPAGRTLATYLRYRNQVIQEMEELTANTDERYVRGDGLVSTRKDMTANRQWLRDQGEYLASENPEFKRVWDLVLSREVRKGTVSGEEEETNAD